VRPLAARSPRGRGAIGAVSLIQDLRVDRPRGDPLDVRGPEGALRAPGGPPESRAGGDRGGSPAQD